MSDYFEIQVRLNVLWKYVASRGYHFYNQTNWATEDQYPGRQVFITHETCPTSRLCDPYSCAVQIRYEGTYRDRLDTVGHIPRETSRFVFYFIEMGCIVEGIVADISHRRSPIPSGGLEIKLKLYFRHSSISLVEQLGSFIARYDYELDRQPVVRENVEVEEAEDQLQDSDHAIM